MAERTGTGIFPRELMNRFPLLPLEEEGRLNDMPLRENFIERIFAYRRWTQLLRNDPTPGGLAHFHTAHKLTLMAHSPKHYTELGRLVARAGTICADLPQFQKAQQSICCWKANVVYCDRISRAESASRLRSNPRR
jgi:hypothetical protein